MRNIIDELTKQATDQGKLIEIGWLALRKMCIAENASDIQISEMRNSFFAGAQHLYASIMSVLEPGSEPTDKDLDRMRLIDNELREFITAYKEEHMV